MTSIFGKRKRDQFDNIYVDQDAIIDGDCTIGGNLTVDGDANIPVVLPNILEVSDGSDAAPSYTFSSDTSTGMEKSAPYEISFVTGGNKRLKIDSNGISPLVPVYMSPNLLSVGPIVGTGSISGTNTQMEDGSIGSPSYTFTSDTTTGICKSGTSTLSIVAGGDQQIIISPSEVFLSPAVVLDSTMNVSGTTTLSTLTSTGAVTCNSTVSTGALTAASLNCSGTASTGALTAASLTCSGTASTGALTASSLTCSGTASTGALTVAGAIGCGTNNVSCGLVVPSTLYQFDAYQNTGQSSRKYFFNSSLLGYRFNK